MGLKTCLMLRFAPIVTLGRRYSSLCPHVCFSLRARGIFVCSGIFLLLISLCGCSLYKDGIEGKLLCGDIYKSAQGCEEAQDAYKEFLLAWLGPELALAYVGDPQICTNCAEKRAETSMLVYHHAASSCVNLLHNEYAQARIHMKSALKLQPDYVPAQLLLAEVMRAQEGPAAALAQIKKILAVEPSLTRLHLRKSMLHMEQQDYARAASDLKYFLNTYPDTKEVLLQLGRIQQRQQLWSEAEKTFQTLIDLAPDEPLAYLELGQVLEQQEYFTRALSLYRNAAAKFDESRLEFDYMQAQLLLNMEDYVEAVNVLRTAIAQHKNASIWPSLQLLYGYSLLRLEEYAAAVPELRAAAEELEFNGRAWHWLGEAHERQQQWYAAIASFQQINPEQQEHTSALLHLAGLYHVVGYNQDTITALETVLEKGTIAPTIDSPLGSVLLSAVVYQKLSYLYLLEQNTSAAEGVLLRGLELYPDDENLAYHLGLLYAVSGNYPAAIHYLEQVVRVQPEHAEALNNLAFIYAQSSKQLKRAADMAQRALRLEQRAAYYDTLGWIYFKQQRYTAALEQIQQAHLLQADDAQILEHLGDVYAAMHQMEQARVAYLKALHIQPDNSQLLEKLNLECQEGVPSCEEQ